MSTDEKLVVMLFIIIIAAIVAIWLTSWQPVHATCYLGEDGTPSIDGQRKDYYGFQMNIDRFSKAPILRKHLIIEENDTVKYTGFNKGTLWKECNLW